MASVSGLLKKRKRIREEIYKREEHFDSWLRSVVLRHLKPDMGDSEGEFFVDLWDALHLPKLDSMHFSKAEIEALRHIPSGSKKATLLSRSSSLVGRARKLDALGRSVRMGLLRSPQFTINELRELHARYGQEFPEPGFDLEQLSNEVNEFDRQLEEVNQQIEKAKEERRGREALLNEKKRIEQQIKRNNKRIAELNRETQEIFNSSSTPGLMHAEFEKAVHSDSKLEEAIVDLVGALKSEKDELKRSKMLKEHHEWLIWEHEKRGIPVPNALMRFYHINMKSISLLENSRSLLARLNNIYRQLGEKPKGEQRVRPKKAIPKAVGTPPAGPLEQEVARHQHELDMLLRKREEYGRREKELLGRVSRLGPEIASRMPKSPSAEEAAGSLMGLFDKEELNSLYRAVARVYSHDAVKASGINADSLEITHSNGGVKYADPQAIEVISSAREKLMNGEVKPGTTRAAWEYLNDLNKAMGESFGTIIPNFDPTEGSHWDKLSRIVNAVYGVMELHKELARHIGEYAALNDRIAKRQSLLEDAKRRLEKKRLRK